MMKQPSVITVWGCYGMLLMVPLTHSVSDAYALGNAMLLPPPGFDEGACINRRSSTNSQSASPVISPISRTASNNRSPSSRTNISPSISGTSIGNNKSPSDGRGSPNEIILPSTGHTLGVNNNLDNTQADRRPSEPGKFRQIIPNQDIFDYSKLSNQEIQKLLDNMAKTQVVPDRKLHQTILDSLNINHGFVPGKIPSYAELQQQLNNLNEIAKIQRARALASGGRQGKRRKKRRSHTLKKILNKRSSPINWPAMFGGELPIAFCACIELGEIESEYDIQSPLQYKCNPGLACACHPDGVT